jgi:Mrp family chromosome partitioning ATPase
VGIRDALEEQTRDSAKVQGNLYMASLADPVSGKVGVVPKTLSGLVPRMKASDYDYIIFDLPPITQTSATSKVAGLLDMTFVVVESEKTQLDFAKKATALLSESRANVAAVLNKHRPYLPSRLNTDL